MNKPNIDNGFKDDISFYFKKNFLEWRDFLKYSTEGNI